MNITLTNCYLALAISLIGLPLSRSAEAQNSAARENIALGKKVVLDPAPNYSFSTDPEDDKQLTDGRYSSLDDVQRKEDSTSIWVQKGTVGWTSTSPAIITIDLGSIQPISGVSYSTAAGAAGVTWPAAIQMAVSDDNQEWHPIGDLVQSSRVNAMPPKVAEGYHNFRYITRNLQTKGRYIAFGVMQAPYTFVDEIEVYKGDEAWLSTPSAKGVASPTVREYFSKMVITNSAQRRLNDDIAAVREEVKASRVSSSIKKTFEARLEKAAQSTLGMGSLPRDFKTVLPLNSIHRDILATRGELLAKEGVKPLTVWKQHRYGALPLLARPSASQKVSLNVSMLRNQFRSDSFLITNASDQAKDVAFSVKGAPRGAMKNWLQVYSVEWTDTLNGVPVAAALVPVKSSNGAYAVRVPGGMTRKVWITVDSSKVPAGEYKSSLSIASASKPLVVPLSLKVLKTPMFRPRLSLGMWDYTNSPTGYDGINLQNMQAAIALMRSHYVDTPWGGPDAMPIPGNDGFDKDGNLTAKLDFSNLDKWINLWKGARRYFVFLAVSDSIAGAKMGSPEFDARVGSWAKAYSRHMQEIGLKPEQLGLLLVDEPGTEGQDVIAAAWAKAINAAAPELTLFSDPVWLRPYETKTQDAITEMDILCPPLGIYMFGGEKVQKYYQDLRARGKELWFYGTSGPSREMNPQHYYRYQAWQAFAAGATGQGYWSFSSAGGAPTSWSAYSETNVSYSPAFLDKDTVYSSVHWEAVREGIEDHEEMAMLADKIKASRNAAWKNQAQQVLDDVVKKVQAAWIVEADWTKRNDTDVVDKQLVRVRALLTGN